jgi:hypothetical protein
MVLLKIKLANFPRYSKQYNNFEVTNYSSTDEKNLLPQSHLREWLTVKPLNIVCTASRKILQFYYKSVYLEIVTLLRRRKQKKPAMTQSRSVET